MYIILAVELIKQSAVVTTINSMFSAPSFGNIKADASIALSSVYAHIQSRDHQREVTQSICKH